MNQMWSNKRTRLHAALWNEWEVNLHFILLYLFNNALTNTLINILAFVIVIMVFVSQKSLWRAYTKVQVLNILNKPFAKRYPIPAKLGY